MRWFPQLLLATLAACSKPAPAATTEAPSETWEPTAFTVTVHGHGRPIILIPGLGCPGAVWDETVAHLGEGYETHVLTLAGFAGVPPIEGQLEAETRQQLVHYIRDRKLVQPLIMGHSLGGFLAYWLAASEPKLVGPTIVVESGTALGDGDAEANAATGAQVRDMWADASDEAYAQQIHDIFGSMAAHRERLKPMLDTIALSDRKAIGEAIYEQYTTDIRVIIPNIQAPVLVVLADGSLAATMRKQAEAVPLHEVVLVPNAKHFVMLDEPQAFESAIEAFLAAHPPTAGGTRAQQHGQSAPGPVAAR